MSVRRLAASAGGWLVMGGMASSGIAAVLPPYRLLRRLDPDAALPHRVSNALWGRAAFRVAPWWSIEVRGREHLRAAGDGGGYLLCPNHQSFMDVPSLHALGVHFKWVLHDRFHRVPGFAAWLRASGYIGVDPLDPLSARAMLDALEGWLRRGVPVALFPEGTRSPSGEVAPFRRGPFRSARELGAPAVPVAIDGTRPILPKGRWTAAEPPPWSIRVHVLPPVAGGAHPTPRAFAAACRDAVVAELERMRATPTGGG